MIKKTANKLHTLRNRVATGCALTVAGIGSALAQAVDPTAPIVAAIEAGGANGIKIAVAMVVAGFGITAIYMMRRKG